MNDSREFRKEAGNIIKNISEVDVELLRFEKRDLPAHVANK